MRSRRVSLASAVLLLLPAASNATQKTYQIDQFSGTGTGNIDGVFAAGEMASVVLTPDPRDYPLTITDVQLEAVPGDGVSAAMQSAFLLDIWNDPADGTVAPSSNPSDHLLSAYSFAVDPTTAGLADVTLTTPVTLTSGSFRVGLTFQQDSIDEIDGIVFATIATDNSALVPNRYFLCTEPLGSMTCSWSTAASLGVPHNYIIRVVATVPDIPVDAGQPDAGQPDAGQPDAGEPDAGQPDAGQPDAGVMEPDAGTPEPDAGQPEQPAPILTGITPSDGTTGSDTPVVIQGFNLTSMTQFSLAESALIETVVTPPNLANSTVPGSIGPGVYDVIATNPDGQRGILPHAFTVNARHKSGCSTGAPALAGWVVLLVLAGRRSRR
jgi:hypothetical protein